jgi:hypothetical protein
MKDNLEELKSTFKATLETLKTSQAEGGPSKGLEGFLSRIQRAENVLIQNQKKIWLKTKKGREALSKFGIAAERLREIIESAGGVDETEAALKALELQAKNIEDEIRRRSMVVT